MAVSVRPSVCVCVCVCLCCVCVCVQERAEIAGGFLAEIMRGARSTMTGTPHAWAEETVGGDSGSRL